MNVDRMRKYNRKGVQPQITLQGNTFINCKCQPAAAAIVLRDAVGNEIVVR